MKLTKFIAAGMVFSTLVMGPVKLAADVDPATVQGVLGLFQSFRYMNFDDEDELKSAREIYEQFQKEEGFLYEGDTELQHFLEGIVLRLRPYAIEDRGAFKKYRVNVINDYRLNAFTVGAGYLYFNSGILARLENEAQLASVVGHEMSHVSKNHIQRSIHKQAKLTGLLSLSILGFKDAYAKMSSTAGKVLNMALNAMVNGWGRELEQEADMTGIEYTRKSGYDIREMPHVFEIFLETYGDPDPVGEFFYGSHPSNRKRIQYLQDYIRQVPTDTAAARVNAEEYERVTTPVRLAVGKQMVEQVQYNSAVRLLDRVLGVDSGQLDANFYLAEVMRAKNFKERDLSQSRKYYEKVLDIDPDYALAYRGLGYIFYEQKNWKLSWRHFQRYMDLAPHAEDSRTIKGLLRKIEARME